MELQFSFIVPVYNRPGEIYELLDSVSALEFTEPFEIVIVEDGSTETCQHIVERYKEKLHISYFFKENSGPGDSRNYGMSRAKGNYFIILDSDCLLPPQYMNTVAAYLEEHYCDCYGGADAAHDSFTSLQKAINYVMTSFLTTGGIRGNKKAVQRFEPRSFNMGLSKQAFELTNGFSDIHPGEDPDLSQRIMKLGLKTSFIPNAYVFHKRRISWRKFYQQVKKFGMVRPILNKWHPSSSKITFWFPTLFLFFVLFSIIGPFFISPLVALPLIGYCLIIFIHSSILNKSVTIGLYSIVALFVQFFGYGWGFLKSTFFIHWLHKNPREQFPTLFFK